MNLWLADAASPSATSPAEQRVESVARAATARAQTPVTTAAQNLFGSAILLSLAAACSANLDNPRPDATQPTGVAGTNGAIAGYQPSPQNPCEGPCADDITLRPSPLPRPACPPLPPSVGDGCEVERLRCSYGAGHPECHTYFDCLGGTWQATIGAPGVGACVQPTNCPSEPSSRERCAFETSVPCEYPGQSCVCYARWGGPVGNWLCYGPPRDVKCPATLPNLGEGCAEQGVACSYGQYDCNSPSFTGVFCFRGQWEQQSGGGCAD